MKCPECENKNGKKNMFCEFCGFNLLLYKAEQNLLLIQAKNEFLIQKETEKIRKRIHEKERELNLLIQIHKFKVKTWIISGTLNANFYNDTQMRNWTKKCFDEQNLRFEVNYGKRPSLVFHPTECGKNVKDAIINAKEKTKDIIEMLEQKYEIRLAIPEFDETNIHYLNIKTDPAEVYNSLRNCWSDNSHKQGIETGSAEFADFLFQNERINNHEIKKINIIVGTLGIVFITGILLMIFF